MALHNEGDWRMETWQRARRAGCHVSIRQSPSCVMPFWTHAKCLLAFISYLPMWIKAKYTFIKTVYSPRFYGGPYMQAKHAARTCCHCHLAVKNAIHDGNQGQLKLPKSPKRYHNMVTWHWIVYKWRRSKQRLSFHRTFFNLLVFTVSLSCRDCQGRAVVPSHYWFKYWLDAWSSSSQCTGQRFINNRYTKNKGGTMIYS